MRDEWYTWRNPPREWIEQYAHCPGLSWHWHNKRIVAVTLHRTHTAIVPYAVRDEVIFEKHVVDAETYNHRLLRGYQNHDVPFLLNRHASILGYEMRLGKTATATAACTPSHAKPVVILGPLIARDIWRDWFNRLYSFEPVALESKADIPLVGYPAYFVHFDIADYHTRFFSRLDRISTLVIDEIHLLQARRSKRIGAASSLAIKADRVIGLSGTPMWSNPRSMWPILNLLHPGAWGTEFEFCQRYMDARQSAYGWQYSGLQNNVELMARLGEVVVRRTWTDVLGQLPPVTNILEPVQLNSVERNKYEMLAAKASLESAAVGNRPSAAGYLSRLRRFFGQAKVARAVELAVQAIREGHKVVLWAWHTDVQDELIKHLRSFDISPGQIYAADSQDRRQGYIDAFQHNVDARAMVASLAVGGVAIDLSAADLNIFVELDWIPATVYQAAMRIFNPTRPHANVFMFADVDIERRLVDVLSCNDACQSAIGLGYEEAVSKVFSNPT